MKKWFVNIRNNISGCTDVGGHDLLKTLNQYIENFIDAGADTLIIHTEASSNIDRDLNAIKKRGVKCGLAIKPGTDEGVLNDYIDFLDYVLVMSVEPGFGGQKFIQSSLDKMKKIVDMRGDRKILIGVDGGVNVSTISSVYDTGIDIVVVGSGLYKAENIKDRYNQLLNV